MQEQQKYQIEVPSNPLMQLRARNTIQDILDERDSYQSLSELVVYLLYMQGFIEEALNAIADSLPKEALQKEG